MDKKISKNAGLAIFIIGIGIIVGYALFTGYVSGSEIGKYTVEEFEGDVTAFAGFRWSKGKTITHQVGPLYLMPEMNPLRLILDVSRKGRASSDGIKGLVYTFALVDENGNVVWEKSGHRSISEEEKTDISRIKIAFDAFDISASGDYYLYSNLSDERTIKPIVTNARVILRKNVMKSSSMLYIIVGVITFIGFILMISGMEKKQQ
jgi:hypothetical protein